MTPAPPPPDEPARLAALRATRVLDTPAEREFDDLAVLAGYICGTPIALVSLVDERRQWFKSRVGVDATETPRDVSFCGHAILGDELFEVPDATADERFRDNPFVTGDANVRFYAGMPVPTADGHNLGTLCVIDRVPRALTDEQRAALRVLARQVGAQLELRRQVDRLEQAAVERSAAEAALRASEAKFRATVDRLAEGVFVIDPTTRRFAEVNAALLALLGYSAAEFMTLTVPDIVAGETPDAVERTAGHIDGALARDGRFDLGRKLLRRKDGTAVPVEVRVSLVTDGGAGLHAVIVRDVTEQAEYEDRLFDYQTELEAANAKLRALAVTDGLTGVRNRAAFDTRLIDEFDRAIRYGHPLSLVMMDVDHFKAFNDAFGHPAGDGVLRAVAATLTGTVRGTDAVARYGGEEFAVVLPDTDYAGAMVLAERCRRAVAGRGWDQRAVTVSVGVASLTPTTTDAAALVREADQALYRSKQGGRNRVSYGSGTTPRTATVRIPTS